MPTAIKPMYVWARDFAELTYLPSGNKVVLEDTETKHLMFSSYTNGISNPNYKVLIAQGRDASTPFLRVGGTASTGRFRGELRKTAGIWRYYGSFPPASSGAFGFTHDATLQDLALLRLKRKLSDKLGQAKLAEPIAESHKLGGLIRQAAGLGTDTLQALIDLKANPGKWSAKKLAKHAAGTWLGYNFGVKPLISDINNSIESIGDYLNRRDGFTRVSAGAGRDWSRSLIAPGISAGSEPVLIGKDELLLKQTYKFVAGAKLKVQASNNYSPIEHLGLGLNNVIPLAWELTYASWVVDYFLNVGEYLESSFFTLPGDLVYLNLDERRTCHGERVMTKAADRAGVINFATAGSAEIDYFSFERKKLASLPYPGIHMKYTDQVGQHAVSKLLNLGAFLTKLA